MLFLSACILFLNQVIPFIGGSHAVYFFEGFSSEVR